MGNLGAGCEEAKKPWGMVSEDCKGDKTCFILRKREEGIHDVSKNTDHSSHGDRVDGLPG
jgi:hypothetical protein